MLAYYVLVSFYCFFVSFAGYIYGTNDDLPSFLLLMLCIISLNILVKSVYTKGKTDMAKELEKE